MKEKKGNSVFRLLWLSAAVFFFLYFVALLTLTALVLHTLRHGDFSSSRETPGPTDTFRASTDRLKLVKERKDFPEEFRNEEEEDETPDRIIINARQKREKNGVDGVHRTPSFGGGTVYVRWGRVNCSDTFSTTTLYSGVIGVSYSGHVGGGSNHLCLPFHPEYGYRQKGLQYAVGAGGSLLQGVEYRAENIYPFKNDNNNDVSLDKQDAVCCVCYVSARSVSLTVPAKRSCPPEWTLEYAGYLMTSQHKNYRTDYLCVDESPEGKPSGENTNGGSFLYPVEGGCGALPCPDYREGLELACVVCTK